MKYRFWLVIGLALIAGALLLAQFAGGPADQSPPASQAPHDELDEHDQHDEIDDRTRISADAADAAGIQFERAGPRTIVDAVKLTGTVEIDPARVAMVRPRFAGLVTDVYRTVGDDVQRGETLATIETNESLMRLPVTAPISGLVLERAAQPGQVAGPEPLFVIADPKQLWVQLDVFGDQVTKIRQGQRVEIKTLGGDLIAAEIDWVSPVMAHGSQSLKARVVVPNPDMKLRPGQFVTANVLVDEFEVALAVRLAAIQRYRDSDAIYVREGEVYEARSVQLGRRDTQYAEVLSGLDPGEEYVIENSYLIKADIEKSGASDSH